MSDKQNKDSLLVNQEDALGFYFDSLLLTEESDLSELHEEQEESKKSDDSDSGKVSTDKITEKLDSQEKSNAIKSDNDLQSAKDFLQASKQRQNVQKEKQTTALNTPVVQVQKDTKSVDFMADSVIKSQLEKQACNIESEKSISFRTVSAKVISKGPISPKPRNRNHTTEKKITAVSTKIVFSTKNSDGEINKQILIPRSQRLAAAKKINTPPISQQVSPMINTSQGNQKQNEKKQAAQEPLADIEPSANKKTLADTQSLAHLDTLMTKSVLSEKSKTSIKKTKIVSKEAPSLDLSLFLPKIKTLSEEEIALQIEALTQAAVTQSQVESEQTHVAELEAYVAELEQTNQKLIEAQTESGGLIRNIENAPPWAIPDFQVLLFMVSGLKLAVPLTELNGILEWGDEYITELPGHKPWYLGIIQNQGKSVPVIDTLQYVVPQNRWPANHLKEKKFKHIIMIENAQWGLACEKVLEVITLKTDAVKWRSSRTKRRWLLGTVIDHMCALLDSSELAAMLKTGDDSLID